MLFVRKLSAFALCCCLLVAVLTGPLFGPVHAAGVVADEPAAFSAQELVDQAMTLVSVNDHTTEEDLAAAITDAIDDDRYEVAVTDFYLLRSVTQVQDYSGILIEGKPGHLAAVVTVSDGETAVQATVSKSIPYSTKEYQYTEDEVSTEDDFIFADDMHTMLDFYVGDAKKIVVPEGVTEIAYGWLDPYDWEKCEVLVLPNSLRTIPDDLLYGSYGLETIVFGDGLTALSRGACAKLPLLQYVRLPETLEIISGYAFDCCVSLASIRIPESVTKIDDCAFRFTLMREITVPASVTYIGDYAFANSFAAANQLHQGSDNVVRWHPFANANDPRIALIQARADREVDWFGTDADAPIWDNLADVVHSGTVLSTPKAVTLLNKDVTLGRNVFGGSGSWCDGGCTVNIAADAACEASIQAQIDSNPLGCSWGARDMTIAEVAARTIVAVNGLRLRRPATTNDLLSALSAHYFTTQVTVEVENFAMNSDDALLGTVTFTQGDLSLTVALNENEIPCPHVYDDDADSTCNICGLVRDLSDSQSGGLQGLILEFSDGIMLDFDPQRKTVTVLNGTTLANAFRNLLQYSDLTVDCYDEDGDYIPAEYHGTAVIRDGFYVEIFADNTMISEWVFAVKDSISHTGSSPVTILDPTKLRADANSYTLTTPQGTTIADLVSVLSLSDGVALDFYDEKGNYIPAEYYDVATVRNGFELHIWDGTDLCGTWLFAVTDKIDLTDIGIWGVDPENHVINLRFGSTVADLAAFLPSDGTVEVVFYDENGNYVPAEFYSAATIRDGYSLQVQKNDVTVSSWTFSVTEACDEHTYDDDCDTKCNVCGEQRDGGHTCDGGVCTACCRDVITYTITITVTFDSGLSITYTITIVTAEENDANHQYDGANDPTCNNCGATREVENDHIPGDFNGDGETNNRDLVLLQRYLNGWTDLPVTEDYLDVNGDSEINNRDLVLLQRYLNDWDVTIH